MTIKIARRSATVTLHPGTTIARLEELTDAVDAAERAERGQKRVGSKSDAMRLAKEHDNLLAAADHDAVKVTMWAIGRRDWARLADDHPPRPEEKQDETYGVNMKTFPDGLVPLSLLDPNELPDGDYDAKVKLGNERVEEFGDLSQVQWMKLIRAAWDVNVGDDALPKSSLVSLLQARKERDLKRQRDSG